jgi:hypothetical protein
LGEDGWEYGLKSMKRKVEIVLLLCSIDHTVSQFVSLSS